MNREKVLKLIALDIKRTKEIIVKAQDNNNEKDAIHFNAVLETYENIEERFKNGVW